MKFYEKAQLPHVVYRMFAGDGALLYVGCSQNPLGGRISHHGTQKPWAREVTNITLEWYDDYWSAAKKEAEAILREGPKYNRTRVKPQDVGMTSLRKAARRARGDGTTCPRCGNPKEDPKPGQAYCKKCAAEYRRLYRLKKQAAGE